MPWWNPRARFRRTSAQTSSSVTSRSPRRASTRRTSFGFRCTKRETRNSQSAGRRCWRLCIQVRTKLQIQKPMPSVTKFVLCTKVGKVYRRLHTRAGLGHATLKKSIFRLWHIPIKLDPLTPKMGLLTLFGAPKASKIAYEVWHSEFCMPNEKFWEMAQASLQKPQIQKRPFL